MEGQYTVATAVRILELINDSLTDNLPKSTDRLAYYQLCLVFAEEVLKMFGRNAFYRRTINSAIADINAQIEFEKSC